MFYFLFLVFFPSNSSLSSSDLFSNTAQENVNIVIQEMEHSYNAYKENCWGYDELFPKSVSCRVIYDKSLLYTPIDGLDTLLIMNHSQYLINETINS